MTTALIMAVVYCVRAVQSYMSKKTSGLLTKRSTLVLFCIYEFSLSALFGLVSVALSGGFKGFGSAVVLYGVLSGLAMLLSTVCSLTAMKSGTISLVSLFGTAGLIVPCLANHFFFHKRMSIMQWVGIAVFIAAAYLLIATSKNVFGKFSFKTFLLLIGALAAEGFTMVFQQLFAESSKTPNVTLFSFVSFLSIAVLMLPVLPVIAATEKEKLKPMDKRLIIPGLVAALAILFISILVTYATSIASPVVIFTFSAGGIMIISALVGIVFFKEKISIKGWIGILLGITSMIFLKVFEI